MTRKDFQLIADCVKDAIPNGDRNSIHLVALNLANRLHTTNPNFDRSRFMAACGTVERRG